jgi:hypothetical protein
MITLINKTVTTTNASATTILQIANVGINSTFRISGEIAGRKSDFSAAYTCSFEALCRRGASGNLILVSSAIVNPMHDSVTGTPSASIAVVSPHCNVSVTGVTGETWVWDVELKKMDIV